MSLHEKVAIVTGSSRGLGRSIAERLAQDGASVAQMGEKAIPKNAQMSSFDRLGVPKDIADVVAFVASEEARWITEHNLLADGGYSLFNGSDPLES
jgi:NAD(P)-dependent dehydrogenase (short-subunit alcohol dehydrogenase family)